MSQRGVSLIELAVCLGLVGLLTIFLLNLLPASINTIREAEVRYQASKQLRSTLESYEQLALGYLAVVRKEDGALIGRCGLMDLVVESTAPEHGIRKGWFGDAEAPADVALTFECELGYTFDPAVWGQGFAAEAVHCVRDYSHDVLLLSYAISAILPRNARSRRVAERFGVRADGQMEVVGLTFDRYLWPLATGGATRPPPASTQ